MDKLNRFGSFEIIGKNLRGALSSWKENVEEFKVDFKYLVHKNFITVTEKRKLENAHQIVANSPLVEASFMHSDFSPQHIFSGGKTITGIIDLAPCYAGDPHKDITNIQYFLNQKQLKAFNHGYGPVAQHELIAPYSLLTAASKVSISIKKKFHGKTAKRP
jgi:aminoglycoside phosphotransferase (APT) family kinase protein